MRLGRKTACGAGTALMIVVSFACSGDDTEADAGATAASTSGAGGGATEWDAFCETRGALGCQGFDVATCKGQAACALALVRDEGQAELLDCLRQECPWDLEGGCMSKLIGVPLSSQGKAFLDACNAHADACSSSDDTCVSGIVLSDAMIAKLAPCLDEATCDEVEACLDGFFQTDFDTCKAWLG